MGKYKFFTGNDSSEFFYLCNIFIRDSTGTIADWFGRKISIILGGIILSIGAYVYCIKPAFWMFLVGEFIWAIGFALLSGADQALLYDSLKALGKEKDSKSVLGKCHSIHFISLMISAPIGSYIAKYLGLQYSFMFMIFPFLIATILAFLLKEPAIEKEQRKSSYWKTMCNGISHLRNNKRLLILLLDHIPIAILSFFIVWLYQLVLQRLHFSIKYFGFVHASMTLVQASMVNTFPFFERIFGGKRNYIILSGIITGIGFISTAFMHDTTSVIIGVLLVCAFGLTRRTFFHNYFNKYIESYHRATVLSVISMITRFCAAVCNLLCGKLAEINLSMTLLIFGIIIILASIITKTKEHYLKD